VIFGGDSGATTGSAWAIDSDGGATTASVGEEGKGGIDETIRGGMGDGLRLEIAFGGTGGIGIGRALVEGCICG
jgi:hypothetical protein